MTDGYQSKKTRSPSYPGVSLPTAIERAEQLYERENRHAAPVPAVLTHWGYSHKSGPGFTTLAAVKQFGLTEDEGRGPDRRVRLSPLGLRIVQDRRPGSEARAAAIREAALRPGVYSELWRTFGIDASDENLKFALVRQGFTEHAAGEVVEGYRETISFAQLSAGDTVGSDAEEADQDGGDRFSPPAPPSGQQRGRTMNESVTYAVPVAAGADVKVEGRFPLTEGEWNQFMTVLNAMKPGLVAERGSAESEPDD